MEQTVAAPRAQPAEVDAAGARRTESRSQAHLSGPDTMMLRFDDRADGVHRHIQLEIPVDDHVVVLAPRGDLVHRAREAAADVARRVRLALLEPGLELPHRRGHHEHVEALRIARAELPGALRVDELMRLGPSAQLGRSSEGTRDRAGQARRQLTPRARMDRARRRPGQALLACRHDGRPGARERRPRRADLKGNAMAAEVIAPVVGPDDPRRFTDSGIEIEQVYTDDAVAPGLEDRLGEPGQFPFTRGIHPDMYRSRKWTMRQYAGYATAQETNERFHYLIKHLKL